MIIPVSIAFGVSVLAFAISVVVTQKERQRGQRFFAVRARAWLDKVADKTGRWWLDSWNHFIKYVLQLNWYYSIHSVLRTILKVLVAFYTYFENVFERNRSRTKELRSEKQQLGEFNHLQQMAKHKKDTALTPTQQKKLRKKKLEEKH